MQYNDKSQPIYCPEKCQQARRRPRNTHTVADLSADTSPYPHQDKLLFTQHLLVLPVEENGHRRQGLKCDLFMIPAGLTVFIYSHQWC